MAAVAVLISSSGIVGRPSITSAATGDIGCEDQSFSGTSEPTRTKRL